MSHAPRLGPAPDPDLNLLLHGSTEALPDQVPLRAGPLALVFEAGDLRYISLGGRELVRRMYGAVRDARWGTVPGRLSDLVVSTGENAFTVTYESEHRDGAIHFVWRARIDGRPDGTIEFTFGGEARSTFEKNRIGLCVLHPMQGCAGAPATGRLTTGGQRDLRFPELVAIEQPIEGFTDLAALTVSPPGALQLELTFEGEAFETEDQRNWIDASFKTYSTPLSLPRPVIVRQGTLVEQRVTLRLLGAGRTATASSAHVRPARVPGHLKVQDVKVPAIGVGLGARDADVPPRTRALLHMMGFVVEGRPLGAGQLDIAETIECVRQHDRCGSVILEAWTPPAPTIEETVRRERADAEMSIERLKGLVALSSESLRGSS